MIVLLRAAAIIAALARVFGLSLSGGGSMMWPLIPAAGLALLALLPTSASSKAVHKVAVGLAALTIVAVAGGLVAYRASEIAEWAFGVTELVIASAFLWVHGSAWKAGQ